ncbi:hypothetical protein [Neisseria mucosa]|uniref:hypothetical protein n=1 Tax=Neisseria mucosa TaxID=488 RepID=UPI000A63527E|nr:hypothetical protein [Neisseria mucosa]
MVNTQRSSENPMQVFRRPLCLDCVSVLVGTVSVVWVLPTKLTSGQVVWNLKCTLQSFGNERRSVDFAHENK